MKWCQKCVLPDTRPNLIIDSSGVCNACINHESKPTINWEERESQFLRVIEQAKENSTGYDCLIPVSGGKDSTWQVIKCLEFGLKPLAVTWKTPGRTAIGQKNLNNLIRLGVDHIDYSINPRVEAKFMWNTFKKLGSTAIPMHLALFNIPLKIACNFKIPLVIWGENSAFEYGSSKDKHKGFLLDSSWLKSYGVTEGTTAKDWESNEITEGDLTAYIGPNEKDLQNAGVRAIFLGYYFMWDPEITKQISSQHGFLANTEGPRTGYYNFADIDDDFISIHHWMKWYKFGFTRLFDNLSIEIRNGRLDRIDALKIISHNGCQKPIQDIEKFCNFSDIDITEFHIEAEKFRNLGIWEQDSNGKWHIPNFLIKEWEWK